MLSLSSFTQQFKIKDDQINNGQKKLVYLAQNSVDAQQEYSKEQIQFVQSNFQNFVNSLNKVIQKKNLVNEIRQSYSYILQNYPLDIFEIIQQIPYYSSIQINAQMKDKICLRVNKEGEEICLEVIKSNSIQEAKNTFNEIQSYIAQRGFIKFNLLNVDIIQQKTECCYIFVESQFINDQFSLGDIIYSYSIPNTQTFSFMLLQNIINLSQKLLTEHNLPITKIDPKNILIDNTAIKQNTISQIIINQYSFEGGDQQCQKYLEIINTIYNSFLSKFKSPSRIFCPISFKLIREYINLISQNSIIEVSQLFVDIQKCIKTIELALQGSSQVRIENELQNQLSIDLYESQLVFLNQATSKLLESTKNYPIKSSDVIKQITNESYLQYLIQDLFVFSEQTNISSINLFCASSSRRFVYDFIFLDLDIFQSVQELNISLEKSNMFGEIFYLDKFKKIVSIRIINKYQKLQPKDVSQFYKIQHLVIFKN
ncbi:hypothetical protein TTHERM_00196580 (macronuclear) [Tetrahymena thermophila SB210]|uniref:Uncharacterized protein n=1 Tax=Tetrahymena thermophila (strain SB210) TaxID=312017 RepID=Q23JX6_TETTS|nr:hypothetical protein TTHERM_00196580 [Tetrahymena thermophila SB210]EAR97067.2 hypothetical protein TTHERM_00196580 [Tetrahymena thermophila SB210]|eukprot:XP_001017312.2 hypothetical protein TTHERM_00196580 [Tetrahymena thermophila SB210]